MRGVRREKNLDRLTRVDRQINKKSSFNEAENGVRKKFAGPSPGKQWKVNDKVIHSAFGEGEITHVFGSGERISLAIKFTGMGPKILDPRLAPLKLLGKED